MQGFRRQGSALIWERNHETIQIEPWGHNSLRVRATVGPKIFADLPQALLIPDPVNVEIEIGDVSATIQNGAITALIDTDMDSRQLSNLFSAGRISFTDSHTGEELLSEKVPGFRAPPARYYKPLSSDLYRLEMMFSAYDGERIYGLGQQQHGVLDQKGAVIDLIQRNTEVTIPFMISSRGYGFLWNNPAVGRVELGSIHTRWVANATRQIDYWITAGETPADILENYTAVTGRAPAFPEWAAGFWQSKLRYRTQEELLDVAREYRRRGLPLSVIVSDYFHWTVQGDWRHDPEAFPDPAGMVRELEEMGVKLMVSVWPTVNPDSENYEEMWQRGLLVRNERGIPVHKPFRDNRSDGRVDVQFYDATNPEAREFIWQKVRDNYYRDGIKLWWLDACEPDYYPNDPDNVRYHLGNGSEVTNIYPLLHEAGFYEGMRAEGETEIVMLCRSAWAGSQRYGIVLWSGDIPSTFETLQVQVRAGLNAGLSGIPWWTTDIGGFFGGDPNTPEFREVLVRWFQYGTFCPVFRLHGYRLPAERMNGGPNEVWSYGDEVYAILESYLFLRERMLPYIMDQMKLAHETGAPPMRPLFFDFPDDEEGAVVDDQFMFGPDLLVSPILETGARSRSIYLPASSTWTDAWTEEVLTGGQWITVDAPLERIPLHLRGEAKLPIRADEQ
jgi:alpha-D-xyloside xylohydrolase